MSKSHDHPENLPQALRAEALETLLIEKGLLVASAVDAVITRYSERVGANEWRQDRRSRLG